MRPRHRCRSASPQEAKIQSFGRGILARRLRCAGFGFVSGPLCLEVELDDLFDDYHWAGGEGPVCAPRRYGSGRGRFQREVHADLASHPNPSRGLDAAVNAYITDVALSTVLAEAGEPDEPSAERDDGGGVVNLDER